MSYHHVCRVCHPDFSHSFSSLEDACERLLPYHVVADYEAEEDDRILDSDPTGQALSHSQRWDHNIAAKVAEFASSFEKQALASNVITRKRSLEAFRSEERLMIEQKLLHEEKQVMMELRTEIKSRARAGRDAHEGQLRMAAIAQAGQAQVDPQAHAKMMARELIRIGARGLLGSNLLPMNHDLGERGKGVNLDKMTMYNNARKDDKDPCRR